jgi:hypothetical protein
MTILFDYPWLFVGPAFLLLSMALHVQLAPLVETGRVTAEELRRFAGGLAVAALAVAATVGVIQVASSTRSFMCLAQRAVSSTIRSRYPGMEHPRDHYSGSPLLALVQEWG